MLSFTDPVVTVEEADEYVAARQYPGWTGDEVAKGAAILRGQMYIAGLYNGRWREEWESADAPDAVKYAVIEAARQEMIAPGSLSPITAAGPQKVLTGVKGITWQVVNDGSGRRLATIPSVEALLDPIVLPVPGNTRVSTLLRA